MGKNTVIFDLDGLLIDSEIISYQIYRDLVDSHGKNFSLETYIHDYSGKTAVGNMKSLISSYDLPLSLEEGLLFASTREQEYFKEGVSLKEGAKELLSYLKEHQYKIILATSSTPERALQVLRQNHIEDYFDSMVFGTMIKRGKPHPDIFLKANEYAKEPLENCLVLEDSEAGIQAAYDANIDVICIPDMKKPSSIYKNMVTAEMESLKEVIPWLENKNFL